jgi:hypothetical protein
MKSLKLFNATILLLLTLIACNKKSVTPSAITNSSPDQQGVEQVKEKTYNVTHEQVKSSINILAGASGESHPSAKSFRPDTILPPDSSLWVLEAALNYHFDQNPGDHTVSTETVSYSAPLTLINGAAWVSPSNLINVYNQFKSSITQMSAGPQKVKIIDITARIANGQIHYTGSIVLFASMGGVQFTCAPYPPGYMATFSTYWYSGFGCTPYPAPVPDGTAAVTSKLNNCYRFVPGCSNDYYWVSVNSTLFYRAACSGPTTMPSDFLPSAYFSSAVNLCTSGMLYNHSNTLSGTYACSIFAASTINSQILILYAVAAGNAPSIPGIRVANQKLKAWINPFINSSADSGWGNIVTYGFPVCNMNFN